MVWFRLSSFFAALAALTGCMSVRARGGEAVPPTELRLDNGLQAIVKPVPGAKQACVLVLFSIGGSHDPAGRSGISHLVEHLYVTAAAGDTPARTAEQWMKAYPGNAQTGEDYTVIAEMFPVGDLRPRLRDAAARMSTLRIEAADFERERGRLLTEVNNMFGGMPSLAAFNLARERTRPTPHGGRRGGLPAEVSNLSLEDVRAHWKRFYHPGNAVVVVAGGVDANSAVTAITEEFGAVKAGQAPPQIPTLGKARASVDTVILGTKGQPANVATATYPAPPPNSREYPAFLALVGRMSHRMSELGDASRFPPPVYYAVLDGPEVFAVSTTVKPHETQEQVVARLDSFVKSACEPEWRADEASKLTNSYGVFLGISDLPEQVWAQNPYGLALSLGRRRQLGIDPSKLREQVQKLDSAALARAAALLSPAHRSLVIARPR